MSEQDGGVTIRLGGENFSIADFDPRVQTNPYPYTPADGKFYLKIGADHPPDTALDYDLEPVVTPADSWAHAAARGVYQCVSGIVSSFDLIVDSADDESLGLRQTLVKTMTDVIDEAYREHVATLSNPDNTQAWSEHPEWGRALWKENVCTDATQIGYWEWVDQRQANAGVS